MSQFNRRKFIQDTGLASTAGIAASLGASQLIAGQATSKRKPMLTDDELHYLRRFDTRMALT